MRKNKRQSRSFRTLAKLGKSAVFSLLGASRKDSNHCEPIKSGLRACVLFAVAASKCDLSVYSSASLRYEKLVFRSAYSAGLLSQAFALQTLTDRS